MKHLIAFQLDFAAARLADSRSTERNLLAVEDDIPVFVSPAGCLATGVVLVASADALLDFLVDQRLDHEKSGFTCESFHGSASRGEKLRHRQRELDDPVFRRDDLSLLLRRLSSGSRRLLAVLLGHGGSPWVPGY